MQDVQDIFFLSDLSFGLFRVGMELINCIYIGKRQNLERSSMLKDYRRVLSCMSHDCLENFVTCNAKREDLIHKEIQSNNLSMHLE